MKRFFSLLLAALLSAGGAFAAKTPLHHYVLIRTDKGECLLRLYNETPKHRDNFVRLVRDGYYEGLLFHRVIQHFMVQGGDPESRQAEAGQPLGNGGPGYRLPAEIQDGLFHKRGTIGAARDNNPEKESSGSQFYLVQGRVFSQAGLDSLEQYRFQGRKLSSRQRAAYSSIGGTPHLDGNYTVFGELMHGMEVIDSIAAVETDGRDRPVQDLRMAMTVLTRREALNVERQVAGLKPKTGIFVR